MTERIQTLKQYEMARRKALCRKCGVSMAEVNEGFKSFRPEWWKYVLATFEAGGYFSPQHWASLTDHQRYEVRRTHRALAPTPAPPDSFYTKPTGTKE